jgi:hypothetical protein
MPLIHIRTKFYPNYLPSAKGKYIARSAHVKAAFSVEQVCRSAKNAAGYQRIIESEADFTAE